MGPAPPLGAKFQKFLFHFTFYFFLPILTIKWPKYEEKINFGGRLLWSRPRAPSVKKILGTPSTQTRTLCPNGCT